LELLNDRIQYCNKIWNTVKNQFEESLVNSGKATLENIMFAPTKAFERSETKLLDYIDKTKSSLAKKGSSAIESSL